jgi:ribosome-associated toxin RatA of RatAB toxin-antitoxin module
MTVDAVVRRIAFVVIGLLPLILITPANAGNDWTKILPGEIVIESAESQDGLDGIRAVFAVAASRDRIWKVLTDYDNFQEVFPQIDKMIVLEEDDSGATIEYWGSAVVINLHYVLRRSYVEPGRRLTWQHVSGDLERLKGSWQIIESPDPSVHALVYESFADLGFGFVTWAVRLGAMNEARHMALRLRSWIEGVALNHSMPRRSNRHRSKDRGR